MPAFQSIPSNCRDCYKCIRYCPVKAIRAHGNRTDIEEALCIACGICVEVCPQKAKVARDDRGAVLSSIASGRATVLAMDRGFAESFPGIEPGRIVSSARKLGFSEVYDAAGAAHAVGLATMAFAEGSDIAPVIASYCPVTVNIVEKFAPQELKRLAPVCSPMIAQARWVRSELGGDCFVAFAAHCSAAKHESERPEYKGLVNAVLTPTEFFSILEKRGIDPSECDPSEAGNQVAAADGAAFRRPEGIVVITGAGECLKAAASAGERSGIKVLDMRGCSGCPVEAPFACDSGIAHMLGSCPEDGIMYDVGASYSAKDARRPEPSEAEIARVLSAIGRSDPKDRTDCGACGYFTCRDLGAAVLAGMAEAEMCIPYAKSGAEAMGNLVVNESPNGIIGVREDMTVALANPALCRFLGVDAASLVGKTLPGSLEKEPFRKVFESRTSLTRQTSGNCGLARAKETYMFLRSKDMAVLIVTDMSQEFRDREALAKARRETAEKATRVIENQMRVAQQVAGLMGEAAAETKVLLSKLVKQLEEDQGR